MPDCQNHIPPNQFRTTTAFFGTKYRRTNTFTALSRAVPILPKYFKVFRARSNTPPCYAASGTCHAFTAALHLTLRASVANPDARRLLCVTIQTDDAGRIKVF